MMRLVKRLCTLALVTILGSAGCAGLLSSKTALSNLPEKPYEVTRYTSLTKSKAYILDDPNDDILLTFSTGRFQTKNEGLNPPEKYLEKFGGTPEAYQIQDKETEAVLGYLLISSDLEWLMHFDRGEKKVVISIEDPHSTGGNGGE